MSIAPTEQTADGWWRIGMVVGAGSTALLGAATGSEIVAWFALGAVTALSRSGAP